MSITRRVRLAVLMAGVCAVGCVDRRFVIESNVPNAQVYVDNRQVGAAPAHTPFDYYGFYTVKLVYPGYETVTKRVHVVAPWYSYPPFDFLAEVVWPFHVEDVRRYYIPMTPAAQIRTDDLIYSADALRQRGWALPTPPETQPAPNVLQPPIVPATPGPVPGPAPLPPPTPLPGPGGAPVPPNVVPSVTPSGFGPTGATYLR
jgi:hypothetical protein